MPCYYPLEAYKSINPRDNGKSTILFKRPNNAHMFTTIELPCGQCVGCRIRRSQEWSIRCVHEATQHKQNSFITLTYNPENLPLDGSVNVEHFQKFMKRLRKYYAPRLIRFFHCGEYGENLGRPHYHAILFGIDFADKEIHKTDGVKTVYTSKILQKLWGKGFCIIGDVTEQSCSYVARYIMKKINGDKQEEHYMVCNNEETGELTPVHPEYITMSRRPGIGKKWYDRYKQDVYPSDEVIVKRGERNVPIKPPKYYDGLYEIENPVYHAHIKAERTEKAKSNKSENTRERRKVKETILKTKLKKLTRGIH